MAAVLRLLPMLELPLLLLPLLLLPLLLLQLLLPLRGALPPRMVVKEGRFVSRRRRACPCHFPWVAFVAPFDRAAVPRARRRRGSGNCAPQFVGALVRASAANVTQRATVIRDGCKTIADRGFSQREARTQTRRSRNMSW